jgi:putative copper resistance protein D
LELSGWDAAAVCAKAITYAATLGAAGAIFFLAYSGSLLHELPRSRIRRLIGALLLASALASCARVLLGGASMSGELAGMFDSGFVRMILGTSSNPRFRALALLGAATASISFAGVGHIRGLLPNTAPLLLLCMHLLCVAFWLGALGPLLIAARDRSDREVALLASRFGKLALGVVAVQLAAGAALLWTVIRGAAQFWSSDYGRMMAMKLLLVAALLSIAAVNKLYLTPKLLAGHAKAVIQFRRSVRTEMVVGALILLITAAFTTVAGPPQ